MTIPFVDVLIIGGGPGGLSLAQGLKKRRIGVRVVERDLERRDYVQGFRLRVRERGIQALRSNLPSALFTALEETAGRAPADSIALDEHLRPVPSSTRDYGEKEDAHIDRSVSRITLTRILRSGLEDILKSGIAFTHYETGENGHVLAHFADGSAIRTRLLVGADGARSRVRQQLVPDAKSIDTGARRLAGKIPLHRAQHLGLLPLFWEKNVNIRPHDGTSMMITSHVVDTASRRRHGLTDPPAAESGLHLDDTTSYIWWNTAYTRDSLAPDSRLETLDGQQLLCLLLSRIATWDQRLLELIRATEPTTVGLLKVFSSEPGLSWSAGPVTLLGDAAHAMTYFRALGCNSALYDSGLLAAELARVKEGTPLRQAVGEYEGAMRTHGEHAVRSSLDALRHSLGLAT